MRIVLVLVAVILAAAVLSGCPSTAGQSAQEVYAATEQQFEAILANANPVTDYGNSVYYVSLYSGREGRPAYEQPYNPKAAYEAIARLNATESLRMITPVIESKVSGPITVGFMVVADHR